MSGRTLALQVKHFRIQRHNRFDDHEIFINRILRFANFLRQSPRQQKAIKGIASEDLWETHTW